MNKEKQSWTFLQNVSAAWFFFVLPWKFKKAKKMNLNVKGLRRWNFYSLDNHKQYWSVKEKVGVTKQFRKQTASEVTERLPILIGLRSRSFLVSGLVVIASHFALTFAPCTLWAWVVGKSTKCSTRNWCMTLRHKLIA